MPSEQVGEGFVRIVIDDRAAVKGAVELGRKLDEVTKERKVEVDTGPAQRDVKALLAEFDKTTAGMVDKLRATGRAADALGQALGPDLAAKLGRSGLLKTVTDLEKVGLSADEVAANVDQIAGSVRALNAADLGGLTAELNQAGAAADRLSVDMKRASVGGNLFGNIIGDAAASLGPFGLALGQLAEYTSESLFEGLGQRLAAVGPAAASASGPIASLQAGLGALGPAAAPLAGVAAAVAVLGAALAFSDEGFGPLIDGAKELGNFVKPILLDVKDAFDAILSPVGNLVNDLMPLIVVALKASLLPLKALVAGFKAVADVVGKVLSVVVDGLVAGIKFVANAVIDFVNVGIRLYNSIPLVDDLKQIADIDLNGLTKSTDEAAASMQRLANVTVNAFGEVRPAAAGAAGATAQLFTPLQAKAVEMADSFGFATSSIRGMSEADLSALQDQLDGLKAATDEWALRISSQLFPSISSVAEKFQVLFGDSVVGFDFGGITKSLGEIQAQARQLSSLTIGIDASGFTETSKVIGDIVAEQGAEAGLAFAQQFAALTPEKQKEIEQSFRGYKSIADRETAKWKSIGETLGKAIAPELYNAVKLAIEGKPFKPVVIPDVSRVLPPIKAITDREYDLKFTADTERVKRAIAALNNTPVYVPIRPGPGGGRAFAWTGGPVQAGREYVVNELGTESWLPAGAREPVILNAGRSWSLFKPTTSGVVLNHVETANYFARKEVSAQAFAPLPSKPVVVKVEQPATTLNVNVSGSGRSERRVASLLARHVEATRVGVR